MPTIRREKYESIFSLRITVDSSLIAESINVISVEVDQGLNVISHATIAIDSPDALNQFARGSEIKIEFSYDSAPQEPIFEGVVLSHKTSVNGAQSIAIIDCYDEAVTLATELKNSVLNDMTASNAIRETVSASGVRVTADIESTDVSVPLFSQIDMTDWDFITAVALSQQQVLINKNNHLVALTPKVRRPVHALALGNNIISIDTSQGGLVVETRPEVIGRVESPGSLNATVGDSIRLKGLGSDIDGDHYVSGIKHLAENGRWTTTYDFGIDLSQRQQDFDHYDIIPLAEEVPQLVSMVSHSGHSIVVDDEQNVITITTADGNRIVLNDEAQSVLLEDTHNNAVLLNDDAISLTSGRDIKIEAANNITLTAGEDIVIDSQKAITVSASENVIIDSQSDITLDASDNTLIKGTNVGLEAASNLNLTGTASVDLTSSAQTRIVGALVTIN